MRCRSLIRLLTIALGVWLLLMTPTMAAIQPCVSVVGAQQGRIVGDRETSVCLNAPDSSFEAEEYHHLVRRDTDGTQLHEPIVFTKDVGAGSIGLWIAHRDRELLTVTVRFYRPGSGGIVTHYHTVKLTGARIVAIEPLAADLRDSATAALPERERVRVHYTTMEVEWALSGDAHAVNNPAPPL